MFRKGIASIWLRRELMRTDFYELRSKKTLSCPASEWQWLRGNWNDINIYRIHRSTQVVLTNQSLFKTKGCIKM